MGPNFKINRQAKLKASVNKIIRQAKFKSGVNKLYFYVQKPNGTKPRDKVQKLEEEENLRKKETFQMK